jgi:hypothetical protein
MSSDIFYEMVEGRPMRGVFTHGATSEYILIEHVQPDGSVMRETVLRPINQTPPAPVPLPQEAQVDEG